MVRIHVIFFLQAGFILHGGGNIWEWSGGVSAGEHGRQNRICGVIGRIQRISSGTIVNRGRLVGGGKIWAGLAPLGDDALGEEVVNSLTSFGLIGGEDVIEGAILSDDDDYVLDGGGCGYRLAGCCAADITGAPKLTSRANRLVPTAACCLAWARNVGDAMKFLLRDYWIG